jgi:NAD+ kinase
MVTPICPHSLSFRPIVVPAGVDLKIRISEDSRNSAWVSFDGRNRQELRLGDSLRVTTSIYPVPSICAEDQISDWFDSLAECLHWNVRKKQRQLDDYSEHFAYSPVPISVRAAWTAASTTITAAVATRRKASPLRATAR